MELCAKEKNQYWLWLIIEKESRKVLAFSFGKRTNKTYKKLISKLPNNREISSIAMIGEVIGK